MKDSEIEGLLGRPPRLALDDIVNHPRLPEAHKAYLDRFLEVYGGDPFLVRLLIESGRFLVYHLIVVLEAAADPARRETWPTVGLLKQNMALFGLASGRHIDHLIGRHEQRGARLPRGGPILSPTSGSEDARAGSGEEAASCVGHRFPRLDVLNF